MKEADLSYDRGRIDARDESRTRIEALEAVIKSQAWRIEALEAALLEIESLYLNSRSPEYKDVAPAARIARAALDREDH